MKQVQWSTKNILNAIVEVKNGISINIAADRFGIPRSTLKSKIIGKRPLLKPVDMEPDMPPEKWKELKAWLEDYRSKTKKERKGRLDTSNAFMPGKKSTTHDTQKKGT